MLVQRAYKTELDLNDWQITASDSRNACGAASAGTKRKPRVQLAAKKQEPNAL